jgi:hypothetical protein
MIMFLLNVLLYFKDGSQKQLTFFFDDDILQITEYDIFDKIFIFISKCKLKNLLSISCEGAEENRNNTIKFPTYIDSFDFNM